MTRAKFALAEYLEPRRFLSAAPATYLGGCSFTINDAVTTQVLANRFKRVVHSNGTFGISQDANGVVTAAFSRGTFDYYFVVPPVMTGTFSKGKLSLALQNVGTDPYDTGMTITAKVSADGSKITGGTCIIYHGAEIAGKETFAAANLSGFTGSMIYPGSPAALKNSFSGVGVFSGTVTASSFGLQLEQRLMGLSKTPSPKSKGVLTVSSDNSGNLFVKVSNGFLSTSPNISAATLTGNVSGSIITVTGYEPDRTDGLQPVQVNGSSGVVINATLKGKTLTGSISVGPASKPVVMATFSLARIG